MAEFKIGIYDNDISGTLAADGGYTVELNATDGPKSGRDTGYNVTMHRDMRAPKYKISCKCHKRISSRETALFWPYLLQKFVTVRFFSPYTGQVETREMYCTKLTATYVYPKPDGTIIYDDVSFNLVEK